MMRHTHRLANAVVVLLFISGHVTTSAFNFSPLSSVQKDGVIQLARSSPSKTVLCSQQPSDAVSAAVPENENIGSVEESSQILQEWDRLYNPDNIDSAALSMEDVLEKLVPSVIYLNHQATVERNQDSTKGRVMLGICASSAADGVQALKSWVTSLQLPRGLLHGMDKDGVPLELGGAVYIKYNSGGVYTFADIRKSGLGFDALWKPGDALIEPYEEGQYRGVYFQPDLEDGELRQYLMPLDLFQL
eukprot:CAMPEP_0198136396 /NCGR_PEP_ID=MMETSP1443-20131203/51_1 /TAXON_ID=186043 /ORGANISM="Entomoneis sp., Strain CCMP2396" /LENGTH=245 /DNA_ID=CAMNT_0043797611 /DNA_START=48 /DNA_END=785 /DNA_ORIENTATION=+